jgi:hypothetical protein
MWGWTVMVELKRAILPACGLGLGERVAGVGLVEQDLALEVGGFDEVAVDEGEGADAGAGEERGGGGSGGSYADDGDVGGAQQMLAFGSDAGEEYLPGVAVVVGDGVGDGRGKRGRGAIGSGVADLDAGWWFLHRRGEG